MDVRKGSNLKLTVLERLLVLRLLPRQGNLTTLRIVRELERELSFSEEEHAALQFVNNENGAVTWKASGDKEKDVELGEVAHRLVLEGLAAAEASGEQFPIGVMSICEKFGYEPEDDDGTP